MTQHFPCKCKCNVLFLQRWARALRDDCYHAAVDTNNGTEAQNKLFKYTFLPRKKQKATLSSTVTIIVDKYLPSVKYKYLLQTYQQLSQYRQYKSCIPPYLHDRPRSVILHCLERRTSSTKFSAQSLRVIDNDNGTFEIDKTSGGKQTVDFGLKDNTPSCSCKDWIRHHLPCKHFFYSLSICQRLALGKVTTRISKKCLPIDRY